MELWNRRCLGLAQRGYTGAPQRWDWCQEAEEGAHHPPCQNTASESGAGHRHWRCWQAERRLAPARLNLPVFQSMDANADVTSVLALWCSRMAGSVWWSEHAPHIFGSLQGYPGKWAHSFPGGMNILLDDLLRCMDCTFRNVCNYDSMIWLLYEIHQKDSKTVEKYMLRVHEVVVVVKCAYPDQVPNKGEGLRWDHFYYGLIPSLRDVLSFAMADLPEREQADTSFDTLYHLAENWRHPTNCAAWLNEELRPMTLTRVARSIPLPEDMQLL